MCARFQRLDGTVDRLGMHTRDRCIADIARRMDQTRIELRFALIQMKPLQMGSNQLHAAVFNRHRLLDKIHE